MMTRAAEIRAVRITSAEIYSWMQKPVASRRRAFVARIHPGRELDDSRRPDRCAYSHLDNTAIGGANSAAARRRHYPRTLALYWFLRDNKKLEVRDAANLTAAIFNLNISGKQVYSIATTTAPKTRELSGKMRNAMRRTAANRSATPKDLNEKVCADALKRYDAFWKNFPIADRAQKVILAFIAALQTLSETGRKFDDEELVDAAVSMVLGRKDQPVATKEDVLAVSRTEVSELDRGARPAPMRPNGCG